MRCLLSAVMSAALVDGQLTITDTDATGKDNSLTVEVDGTDLVISDANEQFIAAPAGGTLSNGDQTLTIPLSLVTAGLTINGAGGIDMVTFQNGSINLGTARVDVSAETINVNSDLTAGGAVNLSSTGNDSVLSINAPVSAGADSKFAADKMVIGAAVNVGSHVLTLVPESTADANDFIDIGDTFDTNPDTLQLSDAELDFIHAGTIVIGNLSSGTVRITSHIEHAGDSNFQVITRRDIVSDLFESWFTHDGYLSFTANPNATTTGSFWGITLNGMTLNSSGAGNITLNGHGGKGGIGNYGIMLYDGAVIESTGAGQITLTGVGGLGSQNDHGIQIEDAGTRVSSATGNISIQGQGGDSTTSYGVVMHNGAAVVSTDTATIHIDGTGGDTDVSNGVTLSALTNDTRILSVNGDINITGRGGDTNFGFGTRGIAIYDHVLIKSTGTAKINLEGTGGDSRGASRGIEIFTGSRITSAIGDIQITGNGGDNPSAYGVWMLSGAVVDSTGTAKVTIEGTGGDAGDGIGVLLEGTNDGTRVSSVDGDLRIIGNGGFGPGDGPTRGIAMVSGAKVKSTGNARIILDGHGNSGTQGVDIGYGGTEIETVNGDISITGQGGAGGGQNQGIAVYLGAVIKSTGTGEIHLDGTGGSAVSNNQGVQLKDTGTAVTTVSSDIRITGHGGNATGDRNQGVWLSKGASVSSTGSGNITIEGTGGGGVNENNGVMFNAYSNGGATNVTTHDGDITIIGHGSASATGSGNRGIGMYEASAIRSTGLGKISLNGTGGAGSDSARGVELVDQGTLITSVVGDIQIAGQGGGNLYSHGVWMLGGARVASTGTAGVSIEGTGGNASTSSGVALEGAHVSAVDGDISIVGHGGNTTDGGFTRGIVLYSGSTTRSTGTAKIHLDATGGDGIDSSRGIELADPGTLVTSVVGDIHITGRGGNNSSGYGLWMRDGAAIEATKTAKVSINGTGGNGNDGNGVLITGSGNLTRISAVDGDITITGQGGNALGGTTPRGVAVASGAVVESSGTAKILIGGIGGTAVEGARGVEIGDSGTRITSGIGDIQITGQGGPTAYGMGVWIRAGAVVESTNSAKITVTGTGGSNGGEDGGVVLNGYGQFGATRIASLNGDITITGQGGNAALNTYNRGVGMYEGAVIESTGSAKIIINGTGGTGAHSSRAVEIGDAGTRVTSVAGDIQITGQGGDNSYAFGVWIRSGAVVESTDTAKVTITGTGGANGGEGAGVVLNGYGQFGATRIASLNGDITITGNAADAAAYSYNRGFGMYEGAAIESTGTARVIIDGTGAAATDNSRGVEISDSGTRIRSRLGDIQITGQGAASVYGFGVWLRAEAVVESTDTAKVIVTGTGGSGGGNDTGVIFNGYGHSGTTRIVSANGDIVITGQGGNDAANSYNPGVGVYNGSVIQSTGTAKVVINGTGGYGAAYSRGVEFADADTRVTSAIGDIQITGQAGSGGPGNNGVAVYNGAAIESTGSSKVSVSGTGGTGTHSNFGVLIKESNSWISSVNGDIQIVGSGGTGTSGFNAGVLLQAGGSVSSTGVAKIDITGTGGSGVFDGELQVGQAGVWLLDAGSAVTSKDGDIQVTGIGGGGGLGSAANHGVKFQGGAIQTITGGSASVQVTGTTGSGPGSFGIVVDNDAGSVVVDTSAGTGKVTLIANTLEITGSLQPGSINAGGQAVTIHPETAGVEIDLGGADASAKLGLNDSELDRITAGTLNIGNAASGNITVSADITRSAATNMRFVSGGDLLLSGGQIDANGGTLLLDAGASPRGVAPTHAGVDVDANLTTLDGDLSITLNGLVADTSYSQLNVVGGIDLNGVHLQLTGSLIPTVGDTFVIVNNDAADAVVGMFNDLAEGSIVSFNGRRLQITYVGGSDANDVVLTAVNNVPQLTLNGGPVTFSAKANKKGGPVTVLSSVTVVDPDQSPAFGIGGGTLTVSINISAKITKKGFKLHDTIGGFSNVSALGMTNGPAFANGKLAMLITLHANTTAAAIETFLRGITFQTKGDGVKVPQRVLQAQLTDAAGAVSNLLRQPIIVTK